HPRQSQPNAPPAHRPPCPHALHPARAPHPPPHAHHTRLRDAVGNLAVYVRDLIDTRGTVARAVGTAGSLGTIQPLKPRKFLRLLPVLYHESSTNLIKTVYVVHHAHTDIGYTHGQSRIVHWHRDFIRQAMAIASRRADFAWTCEALYPVEQFWQTATES